MDQVVCACGCGHPVVQGRSHRAGPVLYVAGHVSPEGLARRIAASRAGKEAKRFKPPPDWRIPSGRCECGCGERTPIARITRRDRDQYKGHPLRYVSGHNSRGVVGPATSRWKGGRYLHKSGYVYVYAPDHPNNRGGYVLEHRLVYERTHGVSLTAVDLIHHVNEIRHDNRPENLERLDRATHSGRHGALTAWRQRHPEDAKKQMSDGGKKGAAKRWTKILTEHADSSL